MAIPLLYTIPTMQFINIIFANNLNNRQKQRADVAGNCEAETVNCETT